MTIHAPITPATWAVLDGYGFPPVEIIRKTKSTVFYKAWNSDRTKWQERKSLSALPWRGSEEDARKLSGQLRSAEGEYRRRTTAARQWLQARKDDLLGKSERGQ